MSNDTLVSTLLLRVEYSILSHSIGICDNCGQSALIPANVRHVGHGVVAAQVAVEPQHLAVLEADGGEVAAAGAGLGVEAAGAGHAGQGQPPVHLGGGVVVVSVAVAVTWQKTRIRKSLSEGRQM